MRVWVLLLVACGGDKAGDSGDPVVADGPSTVWMENVSAVGGLVPSTGEAQDQTLAPGLLILHAPGWTLLTEGQPIAWPELEPLVEDGNNAPLYGVLAADPDVWVVESFAALDDDYDAVPMHPGDRAELELEVPDGAHLTLAAMLGQSNDVFLAVLDADPGGALVPSLWDAGTEVNEEPGAGPNQAPRQAAPGEGTAEAGVVTAVAPTDPQGFAWPGGAELVAIGVE